MPIIWQNVNTGASGGMHGTANRVETGGLRGLRCQMGEDRPLKDHITMIAGGNVFSLFVCSP